MLGGCVLELGLTVVSLVVIMFELTGALPFVLPIMIAVMLAKQVADGFGRRGIYETWIHLNGYPYLDKVDEYSRDLGVREVMTKIEDLVVITAVGSTIDSLSSSPSYPAVCSFQHLFFWGFLTWHLTVDALLRTQPYKGFPVVTDTRKAILVGYISRSELRFALGRPLRDNTNIRSSEESRGIIRIKYVLLHRSSIP
jgi:chloride channel 3/4/5